MYRNGTLYKWGDKAWFDETIRSIDPAQDILDHIKKGEFWNEYRTYEQDEWGSLDVQVGTEVYIGGDAYWAIDSTNTYYPETCENPKSIDCGEELYRLIDRFLHWRECAVMGVYNHRKFEMKYYGEDPKNLYENNFRVFCRTKKTAGGEEAYEKNNFLEYYAKERDLEFVYELKGYNIFRPFDRIFLSSNNQYNFTVGLPEYLNLAPTAMEIFLTKILNVQYTTKEPEEPLIGSYHLTREGVGISLEIAGEIVWSRDNFDWDKCLRLAFKGLRFYTQYIYGFNVDMRPQSNLYLSNLNTDINSINRLLMKHFDVRLKNWDEPPPIVSKYEVKAESSLQHKKGLNLEIQTKFKITPEFEKPIKYVTTFNRTYTSDTELTAPDTVVTSFSLFKLMSLYLDFNQIDLVNNYFSPGGVNQKDQFFLILCNQVRGISSSSNEGTSILGLIPITDENIKNDRLVHIVPLPSICELPTVNQLISRFDIEIVNLDFEPHPYIKHDGYTVITVQGKNLFSF